MSDNRIYSKEQLEESRKLFLEPNVESGISHGLKMLQKGDMTDFLSSTSVMNNHVERYIIFKCSNAENKKLRIDCAIKANNIKIRAINRLGEALVEKCGGNMIYIEEIQQIE